MKLGITSTFDYSTVANTTAGKELQSFIEHYNRSLQEIVRAFKNRMTFEDQFQGQRIVASLQHGVESNLSINRPQIVGVIPLAVGSGDALTSLVTSVNQQGLLVVTPEFKNASTDKITVTLFVLFPNEG